MKDLFNHVNCNTFLMIETAKGSDTYMTVAKSYAPLNSDQYKANYAKYLQRVKESEKNGLGACIKVNKDFVELNKYVIL